MRKTPLLESGLPASGCIVGSLLAAVMVPWRRSRVGSGADRVLDGKIGESAIIARRSGDPWFVGCMNAGQPRAFDLRLDFLDRGKLYVAQVYADDPSVPTRTHVRLERSLANAAGVLKIAVTAHGGEAIRLAPQGE